MDVLDDLAGEAAEIKEHNAWLTYGQPMHRVRERGAQNKLFDLIDEKALNLQEVRAMAELIFGEAAHELAYPEADWPSFVQQLQHLNATEPHVRDPLRKPEGWKPCMRAWISVKKPYKLRGRRLSRDSCAVM